MKYQIKARTAPKWTIFVMLGLMIGTLRMVLAEPDCSTAGFSSNEVRITIGETSWGQSGCLPSSVYGPIPVPLPPLQRKCDRVDGKVHAGGKQYSKDTTSGECVLVSKYVEGAVSINVGGTGCKYSLIHTNCGDWYFSVGCAKHSGQVKVTATLSADCTVPADGSVDDCGGSKAIHEQYQAIAVIDVEVPEDPEDNDNDNCTLDGDSNGGGSSGGCSNCKKNSPSLSNASVGNHSVNFQVDLGPASPNQRAGYLWLYAEAPSPSLSTPSLLSGPAAKNGVTTLKNPDGSIRQILVPLGMVNVAVSNQFGYSLQFFDTSSIGSVDNYGFYGSNGPAFATWVVQNPDGGATNNRLQIVESRNGTIRNFLYTYVAESNRWDLLQPDNQTVLSTWKIRDSTDASGNTTNYYRQVSVGSQILSFNQKKKLYLANLPNPLLLEEVNGIGAAARTNSYTYYPPAATDGTASLLQLAAYAEGNWTYYLYDSLGRQTYVYSALGNSTLPGTNGAPNPSSSPCKKTSFGYALEGDAENPFTVVTNTVSMYTSESQWQEVSRVYNVTRPGYSETVLCPLPGAGRDDSGNIRTITTSYVTSDWMNGLPDSITHPDGTTTYYSYPDAYTATQHDPDNTTTTTIVDIFGHILSRVRVDNNLQVALTRDIYCYSNSLGVAFDVLRRGYNVTNVAGLTTQYRFNDCCGYSTMTNADGLGTQYYYNIYRMQAGSSVYYDGGAGIEITNILDPLGRVLVSQRIGSDSSVITLQQYQYDTLGNVVRQTNALGGVTTTTNVIVGHQLYVTNTYPDGGVRVDLYYGDGTLQSTMGSAVHGTRYSYGVEQDPNDDTWRSVTTETKLNADGSASSEWTKTFTDGAGRDYLTVYSAVATPYPFAEKFYNEYGQLWKSVDPDTNVTLYIYYHNTSDINEGQVQYTIQPLDSDTLSIANYDSLSFGALQSVDRIQMQVQHIVQSSGGIPDYVQTSTFVWTNNESDSTGTLVASNAVTTGGLTNWSTRYRDANTAVAARSQTSYSGTGHTIKAIAPDGSYSISSYPYGRLGAITNMDSTGNIQVSATTYTYDAQGRQYQVTDARNGTTTYGYNGADLVSSVTTPNPGAGSSAESTTTYHNPMLQATNTVQPDGTGVTNAYCLTGELLRTSGSRTYPVAYGYDYAGRMKYMTNWQAYPSSGAEVTTWNYDAYRGFLTSKSYNNGASAGPSYTYTPAGRLSSRTWARGVITSYYYDNAGGLTNILYSDATPSVTNYYDRLGRLASTICGGMTDNFTYDLANDAINDTYSGGILDGLSLTNSYDPFLRRTNVSLLNSSSPVASTAYGFDTASRLRIVGDGNGNSAAYSYVANSPLVGQIIFTNATTQRMTTAKAYDYLNRLSSVSSTGSGMSGAASYNYSYNSANQRTKTTQCDNSYWVYNYDALGQVTSGHKYFYDNTPVPGQQFDYAFDTIGNRTQAKTGGDASGANQRTANYTNDLLNRITGRDIVPYVDVKGISIATNTVTVNTQTAARKWEYYRSELNVNNTNAALWTNILVAANGQTSVTGNVFVAQQPESFAYDADGNLTQDGRWTYGWDAENRLTNMTSMNTAPTSSKFKLGFTYDAKSRRIQKVVSTNNGTAYYPQSTNRFVYDGWNVIATLNPNSTLRNAFRWGLDLSGSSQGAGGVGGLLEVSYYGTSTTNCFVAYDGNGNVAALVNGADGTVVAQYEYGPFGELLRATGPMAKANPFRFSTKYQDDESDLLYYGYRYYNASTGRWLSRDPLEEGGGLNLYGFAVNDPVQKIDRLGREALCYYDDHGVWTCRSPLEGCCNGQRYLYSTHCCCKGKVIAKAPTETGIQTWKWVDPVSNPANPGGAPDMHVWLTWDSQDGGPGSVDANAVIGTGFVRSPAAGITLDKTPPPTSTSVKLSKCSYDFKCIKRCLDSKAKYWAAQGRYTGGNCQDFVNMLLSTCEADCKGCTSD